MMNAPGKKITVFNAISIMSSLEMSRTVRFLKKHLGAHEKSKENILAAVEYALSPVLTQGGFVINYFEEDNLLGSLVLNQTGMSGYMSESLLVYIAVHTDHRRKGIGRKLMERALKLSKGDISLHMTRDNPAQGFFKKLEFEIPAVEMKLKRNLSDKDE